MHKYFDLTNKHVIELGCFEGVHTVGLCHFAEKVTAIDSRIENVVKTIVRCAFYGFHPTVFKCNIEEVHPWPSADTMFHVGVLYHLQDPVRHLLEIGQHIRYGILLDTHFCLSHEAVNHYLADGRKFSYKNFKESGYVDVFSGMYNHSKWLLLEDITALLRETGFHKVNLIEQRTERNGPRALIIAQKSD